MVSPYRHPAPVLVEPTSPPRPWLTRKLTRLRRRFARWVGRGSRTRPRDLFFAREGRPSIRIVVVCLALDFVATVLEHHGR